MPVMLERWNDDKMDALASKVDGLGAQMEKGFARVDADMRETKSEIAAVRGEMKEGFSRIDARFERMQRQMLQFYGVLIVAMAGVIASQL